MTTKAPPEAPVSAEETRGPRIDPRFRARRIEVRRTEGRRRLHRLALLGAAGAVVMGLWWLTLTPVLDVDHIRVDGATHTGADEVLATIHIHRGDALLTTDVGSAARELTQLPWVATASVRRAWPGTVQVTVVERTAVAALAAKGGGWVVIDRDGRQLGKEKEPALDLVRIAGTSIVPALGVLAGEQYQGALDLAAALPKSMRHTIGAIWPQRDGSLETTVALPGGSTAVARFGAADQLEAKLLALAAVLERADLTRLRVIDLRVPAAPALTRA